MTVQSNADEIQAIPLGQLVLSPANVRKTKADTKAGINELADLIAAEGVLQNLVGYEVTPIEGKRGKTYAIVAGGRRLRALQLLLKKHKITRNYSVPCLITTQERAVAISTTENSGRRSLHPADEFEAFRHMVDAGQSVEDVAARFSVTPLVVRQRLKLANVAPEFIALYREEELTLADLTALAITDDHERQRQVWKGLPEHQRSAYALRQALTESEVSARDPIARFVGVKAYEKAGGRCRRDLFEVDDNVYLMDTELLNRLAREKLDQRAAKIKAEGHAWVDVYLHLDYASRAVYMNVRSSRRPPTEAEQTELAKLDAAREDIDRQLDEADGNDEGREDLHEALEKIEAARDRIGDAQMIPDPEQQALAGAVLSIDPNGKLRVETGLLKSDDAKRFAAATQRRAKTTEEGARTHSAALLLRLTAHRTLALRAVLAQKPDVALAAVTCQLMLRTVLQARYLRQKPLHVDVEEVDLTQFAKDIEATKAHAWLAARREQLRSMVPTDSDELFTWLLERPQAEIIELLAFCVALSADAVQGSEDGSDADALARALQMDLREWWTPTAEGYLKNIPKAAILEAVKQAVSVEAAATLEKLKKAPLAQAAEQQLAGTGWLPSFLRSAWVP